MQLYAVDPGFDLANVLSLQAPDFTRAEPRHSGCSSRGRARSRQGPRRRAVRGDGVGGAAGRIDSACRRRFTVDGADADAVAAAPATVTRVVSSGYFETVGTQTQGGPHVPADRHRDVAAGRDPQRVDGALLLQGSRTRSAARSAGSWSTATGRRPAEIVGVAADSRADGIDQTPMHDDVSARHAGERARRRCSCGRPDRADRARAARRRDDPRARSEPARSITCRRSRRSATRRSRRSG